MFIKNKEISEMNFIKELNQEDLLIELSERIQIELDTLQITLKEFQEKLGCNEAYVQGLLNGFANITMRELADVFTVFDKVVSLNLINSQNGSGESLGRNNSHPLHVIVHLSRNNSAPFDECLLLGRKNGVITDSLMVSFSETDEETKIPDCNNYLENYQLSDNIDDIFKQGILDHAYR